MEQQENNFFADLSLLGDYLEEGTVQGWSHSVRKNTLLLLHKLKTISRKLDNTNLEDELIALEVSLGFGSGVDVEPDNSRIEDHQLRILELIDNAQPLSDEMATETITSDEVKSTEETTTEMVDEPIPEPVDEPIPEPVDETVIESVDDMVYKPTNDMVIESVNWTLEETEVGSIDEIKEDTINEDKAKISIDLNSVDTAHQVDSVSDIITTNKNGIIQLVMCNCPGRDAARELARHLIEARLAACINIIANIGSIYWWKGEIHDTAECQLQIKTSHQSLNDVIDYIKQHHPDDVPEILVIPINEGNLEYFDWVKQETYDRE